MRSSRFGWIWGGATIVCLLVSATFMTQTARAFSSQGFDFFGTLSTIAQGVGFAVVASGAATDKGRETLENILKSLKVPGHRTAEATFGLSLGLLVASYGLNANLYRLGDRYTQAGDRFARDQQWAQPLSNYQRAYQFDPSPAVLLKEGQIQETLGNYDAAIEAYSYGAVGDPHFLTASARASLLRELNTSGWKGGLATEQLSQALANLQRARLHPQAGQDPELLRQIHLNLGFVELARLNFDDVQDVDKPFLAQAQAQFEQAFSWELQQTYPDDYVFRWQDLRAQCYNAASQFVNLVLDVPTEDGAFVYLQGVDPRVSHANVWYSCHEIFVEAGDVEVITDVLLLKTVLSSQTIAPYWTSTTQGVPEATIVDAEALDRLTQTLEDKLEDKQELDVSEIEFGDREAAIIRLAVDDRGHIVDYYTYDPWTLGLARNTAVYDLWNEHAPIVAQRLASGAIAIADLQLEILPDGTSSIQPWGAAYSVDTPFIDIEERPAQIGPSRREVLRSLLIAQIRTGHLSIQEPNSNFVRKLNYRVTLASDGRVIDYEAADNMEREQLNKTPLPYIVSDVSDPGSASIDFLVQFKSSYAVQVSDWPTN